MMTVSINSFLCLYIWHSFAGIAIITALALKLFHDRIRTFCSNIPTVGYSNCILSFGDTIRFWKDAKGMILEGHIKNPGRVFQLPHVDRWVIYVTDLELVSEVSSLPRTKLSLMEASNDLFHVKYTRIHQEQQVVNMIRSRLTRSLSMSLIPGMSEVALDYISRSLKNCENEWISLPALDFMTGCASRVTACLFVGKEKAYDEEYIRLSTEWTHGIIKITCLLNGTPAFCRGIVNWMFNPLPKVLKIAEKNMKPFIIKRLEERGGKLGQREQDDDFLDELFHSNNNKTIDATLILRKILSASFAAIHTTSTILTFVLFYLASHPEYIGSLREEINICVERDQWSKDSLNNMRKLDSFLRESLRLSSVSAASIIRKSIEPITLSDGSCIPKGQLILASPLPTHCNEDIYSHAETFDGLRFYSPNKEAQEPLVSTTLDYFPFGYGPHTCPGRYIASSILKIVVAHIIINYDLKLEHPGRPADLWLGILSYPDKNVRVLFRKRDQTSSGSGGV